MSRLQNAEEAMAAPIAVPNRPDQGIPGPKSDLLLGWRGNALRFFHNPIASMAYLRDTYGKVVRLSTANNAHLLLKPGPESYPLTVFAFGAESNRQILSNSEVFQKRIPRGPDTKIHRLLHTNVAMSTSPKQVQQRRELMRAFTRSHLKLYYDAMVSSAAELLEGWNNGDRIDVFDEMKCMTAKIAVRAFYGMDPQGDNNTIATLMRDLNDLVFSPAAMVPINLPGTPYRRTVAIGNRVYEAICAEIDRKRRHGIGGGDLLSMMMQSQDRDKGHMTDEELIANAFILFFAGYETSSLALAWALFLLAQHPEVMAALAEELESHLGGDPPTYEQIHGLPILDRVVKESLRILGPTVMFPRYVASPATVGAHELPVGSEVIYSTIMTHHDPEIYPEPRRFLPERWCKIKPSAFEYLPFSTGARSCMGTSFASMQIRLILPIIVQQYRLQVIDGTKIDLLAHTQVKPRKNFAMIVHRQDGEFHLSRGRVGGEVLNLVDFGSN